LANHPLATLRNRLIDHILSLKKIDEDYARWALKNYETMFPEPELIKGVRERFDEVRKTHGR
jgi:hypothetical protein